MKGVDLIQGQFIEFLFASFEEFADGLDDRKRGGCGTHEIDLDL